MAIAEITAVVAASKAAYDIAKTMMSLKDEVERNKSISKLLETLLSVQAQALEVQAKAHDLAIENHEIKKKLLEIEDWAKIAEKYTLTDLGAGVYVYAYKKADNSDEPMHYLCTNCFDTKKTKSILQYRDVYDADALYECLACKSEIRCNTDEKPPDPSDPNWQDIEPV